MPSPRSPLVWLALSVAVAALCVRLGVWQVGRLETRRARNAEAVANMAKPELSLGVQAGGGADSVTRYRRVRVSGVFDYANELVLAARPRNGSPGVQIATPLRMAHTDTAVLVMRGWVYSADAASVDLAAWREPDTASVQGFALEFDAPTPTPEPGATPAVRSDSSARRIIRRLEHAVASRAAGAPLAPYYVIVTTPPADSAASHTPARFTEPALSEGSHLSYAVQWFAFAALFGIGGPIVLFRRGRSTSRGISRSAHPGVRP